MRSLAAGFPIFASLFVPTVAAAQSAPSAEEVSLAYFWGDVAKVGVVILALYLIPTWIAISRGHPNISPIFVVNLLLGWTLLGWVTALVWSLVNIPRAPDAVPPVFGGSTILASNDISGQATKLEQQSAVDRILRLKELLDRGAISPAEFDKLKQELLATT